MSAGLQAGATQQGSHIVVLDLWRFHFEIELYPDRVEWFWCDRRTERYGGSEIARSRQGGEP